MTDDELKTLVANLAVAQGHTDEQIKATNQQMKRTDEKLERISIMLGNIGQNQGSVAEEFFYNSLKGNQTLAGVHYDFIDKNVSRTSNGISDEYDMILVNGQDVAIIEVKYKAHEEDLTKLLTKKYNNFKKLFPAYKDYRHHLVLATFYLYNFTERTSLTKQCYRFAAQRGYCRKLSADKRCFHLIMTAMTSRAGFVPLSKKYPRPKKTMRPSAACYPRVLEISQAPSGK